MFLDTIINELNKLNKECDFEKLNIKLNIEGRQEYYGMKCQGRYYIFNIVEWKENRSYKKIIYLVDFKEEELYKIEAIYKEIEKNPSGFFDNLFDKFNNSKYKNKTNYNFQFLSLLKKNKSNYHPIIIFDIKDNEIYKPNLYKFLLEKISMKMSSYISNNPYITTIIKIYKNGKFLMNFLIFYNDKLNKYEIAEYKDGRIASEYKLYKRKELGEEIIERIRQWL
ncbi:hypothetical protein [Candidatus Nanobsidianus stetteri]|uniref:Uncharacterized protein n=1 Tax=Nanobsidianus stetteri TaxID=1294122 RepID=A0A2T9WL29_NANST|nr:hypothetical protein [Candidatus Nanobsidianus stetteri]MCC5447276.1 hypothetical protein [Candidatus Nanobsidianus stetteri]